MRNSPRSATSSAEIPLQPWLGHRTHKSGFAAFARYVDSGDLYLEMTWAVLEVEDYRYQSNWTTRV